MANPLNAAASVGVEIEKLRDVVYPQFEQDDVLLTMLPSRTDNLDVSDRLARIPILVQPGSTFNQITPDGASLGTGGGEVYQDGVTTPVYFAQAVQVTKEAEWTTNSKEKAVVNVYKDSFKINLRQFRSNIDALLSSSDGSGTLGTVSSAATAGQLTVNNANNFQAGCTYQVVQSLGSAPRGNITVLTVDSVNNILYLVGTAPAGTSANDLLVVNGAAAVANTSLNGVPAINLSSSTGQWFGIPRSSYPGVLSTPYYGAGNNALTPQIIQLLERLMQRATGIETEDVENCIAHCNVDQAAQWESLGLVTTTGVSTVFTEQGGETRKDFMPKGQIKTLAGRKLVANLHALPKRLDLICLKYWFRVESKPASLFDIDGMTVFPLYGSDGGVATSQVFYFVWGGQIATSRARSGAYTDGLTAPAGF